MKLADLISAEPHETQGGLEIPCEVTPGHYMKRYVEVRVQKGVIVETKDGPRPVTLKHTVKVCSQCWAQFTYDMSKVATALHG